MSLVLITGGARRLGRGLVLEYAKIGWDVAFCYNNSETKASETMNEIYNFSVKAFSSKADITNYDDLKEFFRNVIKNIGTPNVLINNAAIFPPQTSLNDLTPETWHQIIDTNLSSVFYTSKLFAGLALQDSKIINISSIGAYEIWKGRIPYHVSKAGVIQLTRALAHELAPEISVNSISPGTINLTDEPDERWVPAVDNKKTPMKRHANISDIFNLCYYLSTTSNFITGQDFVVDGGYNLTR